MIGTGAYFTSADDLASVSSDIVIDVSKTHLLPEGLSRQLLSVSRDISFREQFFKVRELRIPLTLRLWSIAGPRR
jgi:hypothetical protein